MFKGETAYDNLGKIAKHRLQLFCDRFCHSNLARDYGLGHLVFACHASFPILLSPELANMIWVNFKNYPVRSKLKAGETDAIAVPDLLLSSLCEPIGYNRYEIYPEVRSFLLYLLSNGQWLQNAGIFIEGRTRINELAHFLQQYLHLKTSVDDTDGVGFRQANEWAVQAWLAPATLVLSLGKAFEKTVSDNNKNGQLWLTLQMEKIQTQYERAVIPDGIDQVALNGFYKLYLYGKARTEQLLAGKENAIYEFAEGIGDYGNGEGKAGSVNVQLPLMKNVVERTNRKSKGIQKVWWLNVQPEREDPYKTNFILSDHESINEEIGSYAEKHDLVIDRTVVPDVRESHHSGFLQSLYTVFQKAKEEDLLFLVHLGAYNPVLNKKNSDSQLNSISLTDCFKSSLFTMLVLTAIDTPISFFNPGKLILLTTRQLLKSNGLDNRNFYVAYFLSSFLELIRNLDFAITYRDLFQILRYLQLNEGGKFFNHDTTLLMLATAADFGKYFLMKKKAGNDDFFLVLYSKDHKCWKVIDEDFKIVPVNKAFVITGETADATEVLPAKVMVDSDRNFLQLIEETNELNISKIYKLRGNRPNLAFLLDVSNNPDELSMTTSVLEGLSFDVFAEWRGVTSRGTKKGIKWQEMRETDDELLFVDLLKVQETVMASLGYKPPHSRTVTYSWTIPLDQVAGSIEKFARFHYLKGLTAIRDNYVQYEALDVYVRCRWEKDKRGLEMNSFIVNEEAFYIKGGKIHFNAFAVFVENREDFDVFLDYYLLTSDFAIKRITHQEGDLVQAGHLNIANFNQPDVLRSVITNGMEAEIKVLISRDPMQYDFSQAGITPVKY